MDETGRLGRRAAFTIVELLAVIAILLVTAAFVFSVLGAARVRANEAPCESNLHQLGGAVEIYRADADGEYPLMLPNLIAENPQIVTALRCPADSGAGANKQDTVRVGSKVSLFYWRPYPEGYRQALATADPAHGIAFCVLHGRKLPSVGEADARIDTSGTVLRLLADGSVHIAQVGFHCGPLPNGAQVEFRTEWSLLTDAPCTNGLLCEAAPNPCKDPRE